MKMVYTELERRFDELTPDWIVSTGRLLKLFGEKSKFSCMVQFNGRTVRKASVLNVNGIRTWRTFETKCASPDFVVMSSNAYSAFKTSEDRCSKGLPYIDPFRHLGCKTGWYIELLGSYYHSGQYVQELTREEHEIEMVEAYRSAGARVLLLWEEDVYERWTEVCLPKLNSFLDEAKSNIELPVTVTPLKYDPVMEDVWKSLSDETYWHDLSDRKKVGVVESLSSLYQKLPFPNPDRNMALFDFRRLVKWAKNSSFRKSSHYGMDCCRHFLPIMTQASVVGKPSMAEIWGNSELMKKSILWQLENESGSHNARRFFNSMSHQIGFKVVANMQPSIAAMWANKYGKREGLWFDPCAGWGSRMLASHLLGMKYIGIDANEQLVVELKEMSDFLGIDAEIYHGDSSDHQTVMQVMNGRRADLVFTSPPFFDKEWYSSDPEQSIYMFPDIKEWHQGFLGKLISNTVDVMADGGVLLLNIGMKERLDWTGIDFSNGFQADDFNLEVQIGGKGHQERLLRIAMGESERTQCKLCGRLFSELGSHLERIHGKSLENYRNENPNALTVRKTRKRPRELMYKKRIAYRLPDGSHVRRKDAWLRAWAPQEPSQDSIIEASDVVPVYKQEGVDYVVCSICGYEGRNITRHLRNKHQIEPENYDGPVKSEACEKALSEAANKTWDARGRKEKRDKAQNKTHKVNGLDEETLRRLYDVEGLSDFKIGEKYGMTGEGVSYRRKKFRIETRRRFGVVGN